MRGLLLPAIVLACSLVPAANAQHPMSAAPVAKKIDEAKRCGRQEVGFFVGIRITHPEVLGELARVYANCYPQPFCATPVDVQTIQFDGYANPSGWLWMGPTDSSFTVVQQNALIDSALARANVAAPAGTFVVRMAFFKDIIVGQPYYYVMYFSATFARCSPSRKGMTWFHRSSNAQNGTITVGCAGCDPYQGDTVCTQALPLLCIFKPSQPFSLPNGVSNADQYNQWSGGVVATTQPVPGNTFLASTDATAYCVAQFGPGWRIAEFHDGWGFNFQAYGGTVSAPTHFWVHINDEPAATCWNP